MVSKTKELCPRCAQGKLVTDNESGEMFYSKYNLNTSDLLSSCYRFVYGPPFFIILVCILILNIIMIKTFSNTLNVLLVY